MTDNTNEKMGTIILNGKIYNLDSMSPEELSELEEEVKEQVENKKNEIKKMLNIK